MTPYGTKTIELALLYARHFGGPRGKDSEKALRQHIEQGEPDCRTCFYFNEPTFNDYVWTPAHCGHGECINFSQYKRADYKPLCEVTK